ncbi:hypothetical protein QWY15_05485 [Planococcus sp. N064]|uniref:Uncharacterized protein n=1 Tax=Planococcus liqunii TaxID=3058394 RepID=A0ABT8MPG1_9BACL|nr:hypothetical protein [Planococcus sp. N064]MDN7226745.1 hypothetical protein [Planococcus sp. N064]
MVEYNGNKRTATIACRIGAFNPEERRRYDELREELTVNRSVEELPNGYTFFYPNHPTLLMKMAEWISFENRCCPFIEFSLQVSGETDVIRLDLTGGSAVKELLKAEFRLG